MPALYASPLQLVLLHIVVVGVDGIIGVGVTEPGIIRIDHLVRVRHDTHFSSGFPEERRPDDDAGVELDAGFVLAAAPDVAA